jgi:putative ATP-dependent endonuclease of the OLD family
VTGSGQGFQGDVIDIPALTLIAIEEPENSLAPFYLSRIMNQIAAVTKGPRAQAFVASHSPSILARVEPDQVRHLRLIPNRRTAVVNCIQMPLDDESAAKFLKQAVRAYPELYFARFVVLGEGASQEVILPKLVEAIGLQIDRSFVAIVPLGGRHTNHLWRLLRDLGIPFATLLDLDWGRHGGRWRRIKNTCDQLMGIGVHPNQLFMEQNMLPARLQDVLKRIATNDPRTLFGPHGLQWLNHLRSFNVFFSAPLDIDYLMLQAFPMGYQQLIDGMDGPANKDARDAVLGDKGVLDLYTENDPLMRWYRYLFLGRGKPSTHVRVLGTIPLPQLKNQMPAELRALLNVVAASLSQNAASKGTN